MKNIKRYYSLIDNGTALDVHIYGDILQSSWNEEDVSSFSLVKELEGYEVSEINVYINSYGGEVSEGIAIFNALKRHSAKVTTYCDGFACSAASVVFMAGDERIVYPSSLLMIHNVWVYAAGDAGELRKEAEVIEKMTESASTAYKQNLTISDEELKTMMDNETWIDANDALEMGFATSIVTLPVTARASLSVRNGIADMVKIMYGSARAPRDQYPVLSGIPAISGREPTESVENESILKFFNFRKEKSNDKL